MKLEEVLRHPKSLEAIKHQLQELGLVEEAATVQDQRVYVVTNAALIVWDIAPDGRATTGTIVPWPEVAEVRASAGSTYDDFGTATYRYAITAAGATSLDLSSDDQSRHELSVPSFIGAFLRHICTVR